MSEDPTPYTAPADAAPFDLRAAAQAELARVAAAHAAYEADEAAQQRAACTRRLEALLQKHLGIDATPDGPEITLDGITLGVAGPNSQNLILWRACPGCGERTTSGPITSLYDLGCYLDAPQAECGACRDQRFAVRWSPPPPPTLNERLLAVLREFIAAETAEGRD